MARTGFYGGSFNPVHFGHVGLAANLVKQGVVDEVWFSPSPRNPFKESSTLMPLQRRMELLEKALEGHRGLRVTDVEQSLPVPSFSIDALRKLKKDFPANDFVMIIGADNLPRFTSWKEWKSILEDFGVIVYPREVEEIVLPPELETYASRITLLSGMPLYDISSTHLRESGLFKIDEGTE